MAQIERIKTDKNQLNLLEHIMQMKKTIFLLSIIILIALSGFSQKLSKAPLSPDFINFMEKEKSGEIITETEEGYRLGGVPPPLQLVFSKEHKPVSKDFDPVYDMRTNGRLTPVKSQGSCGSCWAFASMGSVESQWIVSGYGEYNLSENNLKNCSGFDWGPCYQGNHFMTTAYFARGSGPILEVDDPYVDDPQDCLTGLTPNAFVLNAIYFPNDIDIIKQALLDYGGLYTMFYWSDSYYNSNDYTYNYTGSPNENHCVVIAGWDDTKVTAGGTGAWIIKNSWGTSWGENGFFYISYNDHSILRYNSNWPIKTNYSSNTQIYCYDELGNYSAMGYNDPTGYGLVKYISTEKQNLLQVATYAHGSNTQIDIEVFDDFDGSELSNPLGSIMNQICEFPGYYSFDLESDVPIVLEAGEDFFIKVKYFVPGTDYPIPIEDTIPTYASPVIETGVSWISGTGTQGSWYAVGASNPYWPIDLCINALAENIPNITLSLTAGYNFVSSNIIPNEPDMLTVLENILNDNLSFVRNSDGYMIQKIGPNWVNGIGDWVTTEGYLIKMNSADLFIIEGNLIDPLTPIELESGYQFVSYLPEQALDALIALEGILDNLQFARNTAGQMLHKIGETWVNGIGDMTPGEAYIIKMNNSDILIYNFELAKN